MSLSIKLFNQGYLGTRPGNHDDPLPMGYLVPYGTDAASKRKIANVDSWVMDDMPAFIIDNEPQYGFKIAKSAIQNLSEETILIEDPRGFEVSISMLNFTRICSEGIVIKGEIKNECVWANDGNTIILLNTDSERYQQAKENTDRYAASVNTRTVKPGNKILLQNGKIGTYYGQVYTVEKESRTKFDESSVASYGWRGSRQTKCTIDYFFEISTKKKHFMVYEDEDGEEHYELLSTLKTSSILDNKTLSSAELQAKLFTFRKSNYYSCESFRFCFTTDKDPKVSLDLNKGDLNTLFPLQGGSTNKFRNAMFYVITKNGTKLLVKGNDIQHSIAYLQSARNILIEGVIFDDITKLKTGSFEISRNDYYNSTNDSKVYNFAYDEIDEIHEIIVTVESAGVQNKGLF
jgi:uncharacterized protein (DUF1330 family)